MSIIKLCKKIKSMTQGQQQDISTTEGGQWKPSTHRICTWTLLLLLYLLQKAFDMPSYSVSRKQSL